MKYGEIISELKFKGLLNFCGDNISKSPIAAYFLKIYIKLFGYPDIGNRIYFPYLLKFLSPVSGENILDAGSGNGIYLNTLTTEFNIHGWGIDINEEYIAKAKALAKERKSEAKFLKMNLTKINFPDYFFDKIICLQVLQFISDDKKAVNEIARVLKEKGLLVLGFPGKEFYGKPIKSEKNITMQFKRHGYSLDEVELLLGKSNLRVLKKEKISGRLFKKIAFVQGYLYLHSLNILNLIIFPLLVFLAKNDLLFGKAKDNEAIYILKAQKI